LFDTASFLLNNADIPESRAKEAIMSITPAPTPEMPDEERQRQEQQQQEQQYQEQQYQQQQPQQPHQEQQYQQPQYEQPQYQQPQYQQQYPPQPPYQQQYYQQPQYVPPEVQAARRQNTVWKWVVWVFAVLYVAGSVYFILDLRGRLQKVEHSSESLRGDVRELNHKLGDAQADTDALASQLGITKKELARRTADLQRQQRAAEQRLTEQQKQQISAVSGDIAGVKTEVGGVKTDVASTRTDLEATKAKLERAIGDLGVQSGLIARTRGDLETLKHSGDRNYFEFTLSKSKKYTPVSTVSLQLKKADKKHGRFTLNVRSDDRVIEKKDRNIDEPIQFYTGRQHYLYEIVVWTVEKNKISGYLSTPKTAPQPVTASAN
jgi:outer membrane murein-binding lipoprotein Lpp